MNQAAGPGDMKLIQTRAYFDPSSGELVHMHKLVCPSGDELSDERIDAEMRVFSDSLEQRHGRALEHIVVAGEELESQFGHRAKLRVDLGSRTLVADQGAA